MKPVDVQIRRATGLEDYQACVDLQKEVWGYTEMEDIAALPMLMIGNRYGGSVMVAQDPSGRFVGFAFAMPGLTRARRPFWWSHMTAVVKEYRGQDIGLRLKLAQRDTALADGIDEIHWTFDPLQSLNAHFNICKLGVIVREYEENVYGFTSSPLHRGLPTDRFVAEWQLNSDRVRQRIGSGDPTVILRDVDRIPRVNPGEGERSASAALDLEDTVVTLEIPADINKMREADLALARDWQDKIRAACRHYFHRGYAVTDFLMLDSPQPRALYVLEKRIDRPF